MCNNSPCSAAEDAVLLDVLRQPAAIAALTAARDNHWLTIDAEALDKLFAAEPTHPAHRILEPVASTGGTVGLLQYGILSGFFGMAFLLTMFTQQMPPMLFCLWGALGVAAALIAKKYPSRILGWAKRPQTSN